MWQLLSLFWQLGIIINSARQFRINILFTSDTFAMRISHAQKILQIPQKSLQADAYERQHGAEN